MTVADRFQTLMGRIQPTAEELRVYTKHQQTVTQRIKAVYVGSAVERMGSYCRDTAIHNHSDLDLLVRLRRADVRWGNSVVNSKTALNNMRTELQNRYLQTDIGRDKSAVVASFGGGRFSIDIVPGFFEKMVSLNHISGLRPTYAIPDGDGGWLVTSPEAHNQYLREADTRSGGKLKFVVQLLKYWCYCRKPRTPLLNFYLEMRLADSALCVGPKSYATCLADAFQLLSRRKLAGLVDPLGVAGVISATKTEPQKQTALASVDVAAERAAKAVVAESLRNLPEAYRLWTLVFNGAFPAR